MLKMYFRTVRTHQMNNKGPLEKITSVVLNFKKRMYIKMRKFVKRKLKKVRKTIKT